MTAVDRRLERADWSPQEPANRRTVRAAIAVNVVLGAWYLGWLLHIDRVGNPVLFGVLVAAEVFNLVQAVGFWWTVWADGRAEPAPAWPGDLPTVDVLIPVYNEPVDVVEATVRAALAIRGGIVRVVLCDDGGSLEMAALAARHGIDRMVRGSNEGAKAGNLNHAIARTDGDLVAVFDCDHVPDPRFLEATIGHLVDERVAFVQTPQHYANEVDSPVARAASAQQQLFFGVIARGKAARGAMFCCGTNVVFRRAALADVGGFPEDSLVEDFALSVRLHERGWRSAYVPEVLASGLGPEDLTSYASQQRRWAQGCLAGIPAVLKADLPWRLRAQYLSSALYFLSGWTLLVYMALPILRLTLGIQPIAGVGADEFLLHFAPYFVAGIATVVVASGGSYTYAAFALAAASYGVHVRSTLLTVLGRHGRFVVTPKHGSGGRQLRPVGAALVAAAALLGAIVWGLLGDAGPATLNNVAYALIHLAVLLTGVWPALGLTRTVQPDSAAEPVREAA